VNRGKSQTTARRRKTPTKRKSTPSRFQLKIKPSTVAIYLLVFVNSVLIFSSAHKLFRKAVDVSIPATEEAPLRIEVLNGCGVSNVANKFSNTLTYNNYQVVGAANADHFNYEHTILIDLGSEKDKAIEQLRKDIGIGKNDVYLLREDSDADVRIIIGKDFQSLKIFEAIP